MIDIEFLTDCSITDEAYNLIRHTAKYCLAHEAINASVNIVIVSEDEIRRINREFRGIDKVTDVLSFPAWDNSPHELTDGFLGDIAICLKKAEEQAKEYGHSLERELAFLTVHGMLHISGYDHIEKEDEDIMFPLQNQILEELGFSR